MLRLKRGDVIVTAFPFADGLRMKVRPALVYAGPWEFNGVSISWIIMITSSLRYAWPGDVVLADTAGAGLPKTSLIRTLKIACIDTRNVVQKIGVLDKATLNRVRAETRKHIG